MIIAETLTAAQAVELLTASAALDFEWPEAAYDWNVWDDDVWTLANHDEKALAAFVQFLDSEREGSTWTARSFAKAFTDSYKGRYFTLSDFAEERTDQEYEGWRRDDLPDGLTDYIDWDAYAKSEHFNDFTVIELDDFYVFDAEDL
jgi:antirestriction protein